MKEPEILLAKKRRYPLSPLPETAETLVGHSQAALNSFRLMFGTADNPSRLMRRWLHFFKIVPDAGQFYTNGFIACAIHDIGKANSGFQQTVTGTSASQVIRHEHLSGLILNLPEIRDWLMGVAFVNTEVILCSIIGHHLKVDRKTFGQKLSADLDTFAVYSGGIYEVLELVAGDQKVSLPAINGIPEVWSFKKSQSYFELKSHREEVINVVSGFRRRLDQDNELSRLLIAVRAALIIADSAASGLMRERKDIEIWLRNAFNIDAALTNQAIQDKIITPRIEHISKERGSFSWQGFQDAAEHLPSRALLLSSCGSGKTLAAWRWIKGQAALHTISRILFLYPTRGTATEGFRDYVSWAPEADAALIHGTSAFELDGMFENCDDSRRGKDFTTEDRLFALAYWRRRIFSATVDQFLGFMQHVYRSVCLMPLLVDSVIVFDEIHSFDRNLFSALKRFLKAFDVPVLCMTASLPNNRRQDLEQCGLTLFPENMQDFPDLQASANMPRYSVLCLRKERAGYAVAIEALSKGKRILWVVNTVSRCQRLAMEIVALCYHSRFKLEDRKKRHNEVVNAFRPGGDGLIAITTQVCEMSLDLDADVLITENAPITSLIQRMGRCNRHSRPADNKLGEIYIYSPERSAPYNKGELDGVTEFVEEIDGKKVSQSRIEELLEKYGPAAVEPERFAAFLESGPWALTREGSLREEDEFVIQSILDLEIDDYLALKKNHLPVDGMVVAVPRRYTRSDSRTTPFSIAPSSQYHPKYGFLDNPLEALI